VLLASLLLAVGGHGLVATFLRVGNPLEWLLGVSLVAVVLCARNHPLHRFLSGLAVLLVGARLVQPLLEHPAPTFVSQGLAVLACLVGADVSIRRAFAPGRVDAEHIAAALDAYLLAGIAFGVGYWLLEATQPGSLSIASGAPLTPQRAVYFSLITQATVGYGDIAPATETAQGLALIQGIGGQLYLVVLVARLVSLFTTPSPPDADPPRGQPTAGE
jgi:hypothetical protein